MTAKEAQKEFEKLARDNGLSEQEITNVTQVFGNEKFAGAVANGYARHSEYSSALDKAKAAETRAQSYEVWYNQQALPTLTQANNRLAEYEKLYGPVETPRQAQTAAVATGLTKEQVEAMLRNDRTAMAEATVDLLKKQGKVQMSHYKTFGELLDIDQLEAHMKQMRQTDIEAGYSSWVAPKAEAKRTEEIEARIKKEREEAIKDYRSRNRVVETASRPNSVFHDLKKLQDGKTAEGQQDQEAEDAFLSAWRDNASSSAA